MFFEDSNHFCLYNYPNLFTLFGIVFLASMIGTTVAFMFHYFLFFLIFSFILIFFIFCSFKSSSSFSFLIWHCGLREQRSPLDVKVFFVCFLVNYNRFWSIKVYCGIYYNFRILENFLRLIFYYLYSPAHICFYIKKGYIGFASFPVGDVRHRFVTAIVLFFCHFSIFSMLQMVASPTSLPFTNTHPHIT